MNTQFPFLTKHEHFEPTFIVFYLTKGRLSAIYLIKMGLKCTFYLKKEKRKKKKDSSVHFNKKRTYMYLFVKCFTQKCSYE